MALNEESEDSGEQEPSYSIELWQDELIERLVPDPATLPDVIMVVGFLGKSNRAGHVRLYLTPLLNEYLEISENDVLHRQAAPPELNPLGGTLAWVRREANLLHTRTAAQQVQTQFLQGSIAARFLPKTGFENPCFGIFGPITTSRCEVRE
jgi:hypothetical protein